MKTSDCNYIKKKGVYWLEDRLDEIGFTPDMRKREHIIRRIWNKDRSVSGYLIKMIMECEADEATKNTI